jgi:single-strand DNA-binding protein
MGVNRVTLIGNLGRDPELKYTQTGKAVCRLSIATTRKFRNASEELQEETEWHRVVVWGKQAEHCNQYLSKGRSVYVLGRLQTSSYEQDGVKKYSTEVIAQEVQFLGGGKGDDRQGSNSGGGGGPSRPTQARTPPPSDDDIPF